MELNQEYADQAASELYDMRQKYNQEHRSKKELVEILKRHCESMQADLQTIKKIREAYKERIEDLDKLL